MLRPRIAKYGDTGISISIVSTTASFDDSCEILLRKHSLNCRSACDAAATSLRKLARMLDLLSVHPKPFHEESCIEVMRKVSEEPPNETRSN